MQLISNAILHDIEESFGLNRVEENKRNEIITEIVSLVSSRAGLRIIKEFNEEETKEFNEIPQENLEEMERYILAKNAMAREIFAEEAQKIKAEILNSKIKS